MALVAMALLFMLQESRALCEHLPLLVCADIEQLLARFRIWYCSTWRLVD